MAAGDRDSLKVTSDTKTNATKISNVSIDQVLKLNLYLENKIKQMTD